MFSVAEPDHVLGELGDKVVAAIVTSTDGARADLADLRGWRPTWIPQMTQRGVANIIHERIWAHLSAELQPLLDDGVTLVDREPVREVAVTLEGGRTYRLRFKRHSERDLVSSYSTSSDLAFWAGPAAAPTFDGMEEIRLCAGYRWDPLTRDIGEAIVSYREGKTNPIWAARLDTGAGGQASRITWSPAAPNLPTIDLERALRDEVAEGQGTELT
jgi:hypothetical protein